MEAPSILIEEISAMHTGQLVWVNCLGEPFFVENGLLLKVSPETGDVEEVGLASASQIDDLQTAPYWSAYPLKEEWEENNGPLLEGNFLVPITPFVLGGEYEAENLMSMRAEEAIAYYANLRNSLHDLPDGTQVKMVVTK